MLSVVLITYVTMLLVLQRYENNQHLSYVSLWNFKRNFDKLKILQFTTVFGLRNRDSIKDKLSTICDSQCEYTNNVAEISSADAVMFHLKDMMWHGTQYMRGDTGLMFSFPKYRHHEQVWVVFNQEPLTLLWGNLEVFKGTFN